MACDLIGLSDDTDRCPVLNGTGETISRANYKVPSDLTLARIG